MSSTSAIVYIAYNIYIDIDVCKGLGFFLRFSTKVDESFSGSIHYIFDYIFIIRMAVDAKCGGLMV